MVLLELEERKHMPPRVVRYGIHQTPFGECIIGCVDGIGDNQNGAICHLSFLEKLEEWEEPSALERSKECLWKEWRESKLVQDQTGTASLIDTAFSENVHSLTLLARGSQFQLMVWSYLHTIPRGSTMAYAEVAAAIGRPAAARAVARAIAGNTIAYLIPCHRVIRGNGNIYHYKWGVERKQQLLMYEKTGSFSHHHNP